MAEMRYTTITWDEYTRLQRRSEILEWIDADFARKAGMKLSDQVGKILDTGMSMQQMLDRFGQRVKPRRSRAADERLIERQRLADPAPRSEAAADRL